MSEFQLTHVALVGARISLFKEFGFNDRNELSMRRVVPDTGDEPLQEVAQTQRDIMLAAQLPIWVHNIIADPDFPGRHKLLMPIRRFEGELSDSKKDEVVASVLSAGFRNQTLDPLNLPDEMPLRQRCAILMHLGVWQETYKRLENDLVALLSASAADINRWAELSREPGYSNIEA